MARPWRSLTAVVLCLLLISPSSVFSQGYDEDISITETGGNYIEEDPEETVVNLEDEDFPTSCDPPKPPENGYVEGTDFRIGSQVTLKCNPGFFLVGSRTMRCLAVPGLARKMIWDPQDQYYCEEREILEAPHIQEIVEDEDEEKEEEGNEMFNKEELSDAEAWDEREEEEEMVEDEEVGDNESESEFFKEPVMLHGSDSRTENPSEIKELPELCSQPKFTGPCKAAFSRYYYDKNTGECQMFTYGGCKGNKNRFKTLEDCEESCIQ